MARRTGLVLVALAVVVAAGLGLWWLVREGPAPEPPVIVRDTTGGSYWRAQYERAREQVEARDGLVGRLRARVRGLEARRPERIVVSDSVVSLVQETVYVAITVDSDWRARLVGAIPGDSGHTAAVFEGIDLSDCDDGWAIRGTRVVCNRPAFGHLDLVPWAGADAPAAGVIRGEGVGWSVLTAGVALRWTRCDRCRTAVETGIDVHGVWRLRVSRSVRLW